MKSKLLIAGLLISWVISGCDGCTAARMYQDGQNTIVSELSPSALLKKYMWFKDASSALDAKIANLSDLHSRLGDMKVGYGKDSTMRSKWARDDREQYNTWISEESGLKASYNDLSSQYNSEMSKINWRFCNVGDMPKGAEYDKVLPRNYKPYIY